MPHRHSPAYPPGRKVMPSAVHVTPGSRDKQQQGTAGRGFRPRQPGTESQICTRYRPASRAAADEQIGRECARSRQRPAIALGDRLANDRRRRIAGRVTRHGWLMVSPSQARESSGPTGHASRPSRSRTSAMRSVVPPTMVESKSTSLATYQLLSSGQKMFGDRGTNQSRVTHVPILTTSPIDPVNR